jgi:hypothetical protein
MVLPTTPDVPRYDPELVAIVEDEHPAREFYLLIMATVWAGVETDDIVDFGRVSVVYICLEANGLQKARQRLDSVGDFLRLLVDSDGECFSHGRE